MDDTSVEFLARDALKLVGASLCERYHIQRMIGLGGMAAVYAGRHRNGHAVAIKVLHASLLAPEARSAVRREARLANRIDHPVVVPVIDDDVTPDGRVFLVMPLLRGESLRVRAGRLGGRLPLEDVVHVAYALLGALEAAHETGIIHRDLKPDNVFVTTDGAVRLLDFGIGSICSASDGPLVTSSDRPVGTPAFMAPEQALGRVGDIDRRTDLWGLGATMFALLSGHLVHAAATAAETTSLAATRPARALGEVGPHVPGALRDVVDRALAFDRNDRWQDARAMRQALVLACTSALGCPPTALAPLVGAPRDAEEGADGPPTQGRDASRSPAPGAPFDGAMSSPLASQPPTTTGPTSRRHVPVARDQRGRDRLRMPGIVALAIGGAVLVGLAMGGRSAPTGVIAPAASAPLVRPQEATMPAPSPETGTAPPPPVSASAAARAPAATAVPRPSLPPASPRKPPAPAPPPSSSSPKPSCDPPYTIDAAGHHIYKAECD